MKELIRSNLKDVLIFNETQINKIQEEKNCWTCILLLQFIDDYKMIINSLLEENEIQ